jgi:hypothetical protein
LRFISPAAPALGDSGRGDCAARAHGHRRSSSTGCQCVSVSVSLAGSRMFRITVVGIACSSSSRGHSEE